MALAPGVRLGPYEIHSAIAAGGMGEVWKARDTTLGRDVALKILPDHLALDPDRLARFKREAQILASLNHPNIATIHGFHEADGVQALVLELVEGPTLADRIAQGPIPVNEALPIAKQIAESLEAAHDQGIIHRDLKPANIKLRPDGTVKVLDFGLAKAIDPRAASAPGLSMSPTITSPAFTQVGVILGTAAYMSPEQAKGRPVDKRSDVWAFGCVFWEMLTGRRAFAADDVTETLAFIITREPDWSALPAETPPSIRRLLRRALTKNRSERLADIADARIEIKDGLTAPHAEIDVSRVREVPRRGRERTALALAAVCAAAAATALGILYLRRIPAAASPSIRLSIAQPQNAVFTTANLQTVPAVSPDGRRLAFVAASAGSSLLWVRSLDSLDAQPLPGTDGAHFPFWSPDSRELGFFAAGTVKTVDGAGGPVRTIADAPDGFGGAWSPDGVIVFGSFRGGLFTVPANGGSPTPLTTPDASQNETSHRFPSFLPDGRNVLYWAGPPSNTILLGSLDSQEPVRLLNAESQAAYVASGWLLFVREGTLMAQPFDAQRRTLTGHAVAVADQILFDTTGPAAFAASSSMLAYRTDTLRVSTRLTWVDRAGRVLGTVGPPGRYRNPELSPDGTRVAVQAVGPQSRTDDIWLMELARGVASRFTLDPGNDVYPIWSPDSRQIVFASDREGVFNLYQKRADGAGNEERVLQSDAQMRPLSWSPDGNFVVYTTNVSSVRGLGVLPLVGERAPRLFQASKFAEGVGQVSPDGRWIAYGSEESGRWAVHAQSFPAPGGGKWQISKDGGNLPRWARDGRSIFYYAPDGRLMAVPVMGTTALDIGDAVPLFEANLLGGPSVLTGFRPQYDVARDGRLLLNVPIEDTAPTITVVVNWLSKAESEQALIR